MSTLRVAQILMFALPLMAADAEWFRMESEKFEFYRSGNKRTARDTLRHFEEVRQVFLDAMPSSREPEGKVQIIAFRSLKEYTPYRPGNYAIAYYLHGNEQDVIVLSDTGEKAETAATHEYMHLLVRRAGLNLPPWLNEGFAELYSTMRPHPQGVLIGSVLPGRLEQIRLSRWMPLSMILSISETAHAGATTEQASSLYNLGWALTHMLALSEDYRDRWDELITQISSGKDSRAALEDVYDRPLARIESDLKSYVRASRYTGAVLPVKFTRNKEEYPETPVDPLDARIMLADLKARVGKDDSDGRELKALAAEHPQRPEPYAALGYLAWKENDLDEAVVQFGKSYERGNRRRKFLADYGGLVNRTDPQRGAEIFGLLVTQDPENVKYRIGQAWALMTTGEPAKARLALAPVNKISPADAAQLFRLQAAIEIKLNNYQQAQVLTQHWLEHEKDPADRRIATDQLAGLRRALDVQAQGGTVLTVDRSSRPAAQDASNDEAPHLTPPGDEPPRPARRMLSHVQGDFVRLDCKGTQADIILRTADGLLTFLIDDHASVLIDGTSGMKLDLACGAQKPVKIELRYLPPPDGFKGIAGLVRGLKRLQ